MADEKDRFGDTMRLVERAKEDIYFAEQDRQVLEKLRSQLRKVETSDAPRHCPKCPGKLEAYTLRVMRSIAVRNAVEFGWTRVNSRRSSRRLAAARSVGGWIR